MSPFPARPRLAPHVLPRRHVVDGEERVVLHDLREKRAVQIGAREWGLIAAADGTRDVDGIVLAAAREGAHARAAALRGFLEQLHGAGMLVDGIDDPAATVATAEAPTAEPAASAHTVEALGAGSLAGDAPVVDRGSRPLDVLPGFTLHCDGSGSCCRFYGSVIFGPVEAARARALLPMVREGGARHERVFMPERGSGPTGGAAVTYCDGRCAYLGDDDLCALHAAGGPAAKPIGCQTFPASFVDDGEAVRVSVSVECACVLASVDRAGGSALVPARARIRDDLDPTLVIEELDREIPIAGWTSAPRAEFLAWSRHIASVLPASDTAAALLSLAHTVDTDGLDHEAASRAITAPTPISLDEVRALAEPLAKLAARRAAEDAAWRSPRDLVLRAARWIAAAASALADREIAPAILAAPPPAPRSEQFYLAALLHGHRLVGDRPLATALRDRAMRILVARALAPILDAVPEDARDTAAAHPLALVEAMLRSHGLEAYVDDVGP